MGAFDNFDHKTLSGIGLSNDTVMILMQDKSTGGSNSKPNISDTSVSHREWQFKPELGSQILKDYTKAAKNQVLIHCMKFQKSCTIWMKRDEKIIMSNNTAWIMARMYLSKLDIVICINEASQTQTMPSWSAFNL